MRDDNEESMEDVRRWYYGGHAPAGDGPIDADPNFAEDALLVGYEAAHPALQTRDWPDTAQSA